MEANAPHALGGKGLFQGDWGATRVDLHLAPWLPMATAPQEGIKNMGRVGGTCSLADRGVAGTSAVSSQARGSGNPTYPSL